MKAFPCHYVATGVAIADEDGRSCTCKALRLTPAQKRCLQDIRPGCYLPDFARSTIDKLEEYGLIRFFEDPPVHAKKNPSSHTIGYCRTPIGDAVVTRLGYVKSGPTKGPAQ